MNDTVSVIMPSFNSEKYIKRSVMSVLDQTYKDIELIIVDDHSSDKTVDIIREIDDSRIKLFVNEKNSGAAISRNRALREAKGRWIAFLDADDFWVNDKIEKQLEFMKSNGYSASYTDYRIFKNGKWEKCIRIAPNVMNLRKLYNYCYFFTCTVMYDAEVAGLIQITDLKKNNDYAMWFQLLSKTLAYRYPVCTAFYNKHGNSISSVKKYKLIKYHYILYRQELKKSRAMSVLLTLNNIFFGIIKKVFYKKKISDLSLPSDLTKEI